MRERQRALGSEGNVVIEGRDIGTVVAPQAQVKVYLVADEGSGAAALAERPGIGADALATDLRLRDEKDAINMRPAEERSRSTPPTSPSTRSSRGSSRSSSRKHDASAAMHERSTPSGPSAADDRLVRLVTPIRNYGVERVPRNGGVVLAFNHFRWVDPPVFGLLSRAR